MRSWFDDLRVGTRSLTRSPGFSAVVVLTLGVGIAAATLVFSIVNAALYRLYDGYPAADRLMLLVEENRQAGTTALASTPNVADWKRHARSFEFLGGMRARRVTVTSGGEPQSVVSVAVTEDILPMLGARMAAGRRFSGGDHAPGAQPAVVLGHSFWQQHFAGQADAVGRVLTVNGQTSRIVGVVDRSFRLLPFFGTEPDIVTVLSPAAAGDRTNRDVFALATLRPEVSRDRASEEMSRLMAGIAAADPAARGWSVHVRHARGLDLQGEAGFIVILSVGVGFVLLIVCSNVTNLLLSRASARTRELATRAALGARRFRLVRQLFTETMILGAAGSVMGVALAYWACRGIAWSVSGTSFALLDLSLDLRSTGFAAAIAVASAVTAGILPALKASKVSVVDGLKDGRSLVGRLSPGRLRSLIVGVEVALAVVLLVGSGLIITGLINLRHNDPGFDPDRLSYLSVALAEDRYGADEPKARYVEEALTRLSPQPGLEVAATSFLPMTGGELAAVPFTVEGRRADDSNAAAGVMSVSPSFFQTMRIAVKSGRAIEAGDRAGHLPVALVNERFMAKWLEDRSPLGLQVTVDGVARTIVGVVGDVRNFHLNVNPAPCIYVPYAQRPSQSVAFVLRTPDDQGAAVQRARRALAAVDRGQVVRGGRTFEELIAETLGGFDMTSTVVAVLAVVAFGLASVGLYSVIAYSVARRTREIGIRLALGATPRLVASQVVRDALRLAAAGAVPGFLLSLAVGKLLSFRLHRVNPVEPLVTVASLALVFAMVLIGSYVPARRAARVDPVGATRSE